MAIVPKIELKQSQNLVLTQRLQQAISLLQMSYLDLEEFIESKLEENPFLEKEDDLLNPEAESPIDSESDNNPMEELYDADSWEAADRDNNFDSRDDNYLEKTVADKPDLRSHLVFQINATFKDEKELLMAYALLENLDESGYFTANLKEIASRLGTNESKIQAVLKNMQSFEPTGIFARTLKECLTLQLKEQNRFDVIMESFIANLELVAKGDFTGLKKACGCDAEDIRDMLAEIKRLNPRPASEWGGIVGAPIIPEVFVKKDKLGRFVVEINPNTVHRLLINHNYRRTIEGSAAKKAEKKFVREQISAANWLIKSLHQRNTTILNVSESIVRAQNEFFEKGLEHLKPMILKDVASEIGMHESTISRVTNNKYMATPRGIFELKYFFTNALEKTKGADSSMSSEVVKHKIKNYIENEKSVLSDDDISVLLKNEGINVARRTVAKYREAMGYPTSAVRKRTKRFE